MMDFVPPPLLIGGWVDLKKVKCFRARSVEGGGAGGLLGDPPGKGARGVLFVSFMLP